MGETIRAALTPEEWERAGNARRFSIVGGPAPFIAVSTGGGELMPDGRQHDDYRHGYLILPTDRRDAIAATALHGQPFGFTHEDVRQLKALAAAARARVPQPSQGGAAPIGVLVDEWAADWHESLAARVAALLPPDNAHIAGTAASA